MSKELITTGRLTSPFTRSTGEINVKGICKAFEIDRARLPKTIGVARQTVAHYFAKDVRYIKLRIREANEFFTKLNQIYVLLHAVMGENATKKEIVKWFHAPNIALSMKSPRDLVYNKQLDVLIKKLMDVINAAQGG